MTSFWSDHWKNIHTSSCYHHQVEPLKYTPLDIVNSMRPSHAYSSDNGLSPGRRQAIIWPNTGILLIGSLGLNFSEILMYLKMSSAKWRPFCLGLNVLWLGYGTTICALCFLLSYHYDEVTMSAMASQITSLTIVYSTVYSDPDQRKHQSSASLAFERGIHRGPVYSAQMASNAENVSIWWRHHLFLNACLWGFKDSLMAFCWELCSLIFYFFMADVYVVDTFCHCHIAVFGSATSWHVYG